MYSAILMVALSTAPEAPACHVWGYPAYPYAPVTWAWSPYYWSGYWPYWAYWGWPHWPAYWAYYPYWPAYAYPAVAAAPAAPSVTYSVVTIKVPPGGQLLVDGQIAPPPATAANGVMMYRTPDLPATRAFMYTFSVETVLDGRRVRADKLVTFRPGEPIELDFTAGVKVAANP